MNIALFSDTYLPDINGVATSTAILHKELLKHGHNVMIVTTVLPKGKEYDDGDYQVLRIKGLDLKRLYGYRASHIYSFKGMKEIKEFNPDLIHIQTEFSIGIFGKIVAEKLNIPLCYTYHTMWSDYSHYVVPKKFKFLDKGVKKLIQKMSKTYGKHCDELIVPSKKAAEALSSYGVEGRINIIATGLELDHFNPTNINQEEVIKIKDEYQLHDRFVVTFLGRIAPEKSIDVLIDAMVEIKEMNPRILLLIVGGGPQLKELQKKVEKLKLSQNVCFTGFKDPSLVPCFYHASSVFASASLSETQGLTLIEAMATGLPVVTTYDKNLDGVIVNGYNGFFFRDKEELVQLLLKLESTDLTQLSNNALEASKHYSSEIFYERVIKVYQHAMENDDESL